MAQCSLCGADTVLFENGTPVCAKCWDKRQREERIALWRSRTADAKIRYNSAQKRVKECKAELGSHAIPSADGNFAYQQALREENHTRAEYMHLLNICADLLEEETLDNRVVEKLPNT